MTTAKPIDAKLLQSMFSYDPETGDLTWKKRRGKRSGCAAGTVRNQNGKPYLIVKINRKYWRAHRLIWVYVHGAIEGEIDHIDGDGLNNRLANLRMVDRKTNTKNARRRSDNTSGATGIWYVDHARSYRVKVSKKHIGYFRTFEEACIARKNAQAQLGYHPNHGNEKTTSPALSASCGSAAEQLGAGEVGKE